MPDVGYTKFTGIVMVRVQGQIMDFVVDAVSDVLTVTGTDIQPTPDLHGQVDTTSLTGLAKAGEKLVILLDIDKEVCGDHFSYMARFVHGVPRNSHSLNQSSSVAP